METRRYAKLDFDTLKKMGVVLKRAHYFITCNGKMMYKIPIEESYITECLTDDNHKENWEITHQNEKYQQLSLLNKSVGIYDGCNEEFYMEVCLCIYLHARIHLKI